MVNTVATMLGVSSTSPLTGTERAHALSALCPEGALVVITEDTVRHTDYVAWRYSERAGLPLAEAWITAHTYYEQVCKDPVCRSAHLTLVLDSTDYF